MRKSNYRFLSMIATCSVALGASALVTAQDAARETPRPQDVDPAVNTSSPSQAPAAEPQRPQDIDPAVNTSSPSSGDAEDRADPAGAADNSGSRASSSAAAGSTNSSSSGAPNSAPRGTANSPAPPNASTGSTASSPRKGKALDRLELDTTQITGNRELPKVLYIVPWKRADLGDLVGRPVNSLLDEVLAPVDRDVFKRENRYYRALTPAEGQDAGANGAAAPAATPANATPTGNAAPPARDER